MTSKTKLYKFNRHWYIDFKAYYCRSQNKAMQHSTR
uniref:Uncharacterized protein n=1 Tax=Arundo donax TaxID=35708 RepID=A0A0A9CE36_ARUDO